MTEQRVGERERVREREHQDGAWFGAPREGQMPVPVGETATGAGYAAPPQPGAAETSAARWKRRAVRALRDLVISAAIIALVPIGMTLSVSRQWVSANMAPIHNNSMVKLREAEQARRLAAPKNPAISPMRAGELLAALSPQRRESEPFPLRPVASRPTRPWEDATVPEALGGPRGGSWNGPRPEKILGIAAAGISADDIAYLRMIAEAPIWQSVDQIAVAPSVDVIGGRFELPFRPEAHAYAMPIWPFAGSKELAYASVSRAAYYLATGNVREAEAVLTRTIGFGFVFIDNATNLIDVLIGRVIVGIGRSGLEDLYRVTRDPRLADVVAAGREVKLPPGLRRTSLLSPSEAREMALSNANNASLQRAVRLESLNLLAQSTCTNPRELVLGPGRDVRDAYAKASRELARFPGERALLDLMLDSPNRPVDIGNAGRMDPVSRVVVGTSTIASLIFNNPRMSYCTRIVMGNWR
ncbi:MAG: hypothetical protein P3B98_12480 [Gemmatimonadota bacterium]|nr:hypothetical protein [Gemmatimonadota bacterium]